MMRRLLPAFFYILALGVHGLALCMSDEANGPQPWSAERSENQLTVTEQLTNLFLPNDGKFNSLSSNVIRGLIQKGANPNALSYGGDCFRFGTAEVLYRPRNNNVWFEGYHLHSRRHDCSTPFFSAVSYAQETNKMLPVKVLLKYGALVNLPFTEKDSTDKYQVEDIKTHLNLLGKKEEMISAFPNVYTNVKLARLLMQSGGDPYKIGILAPIQTCYNDLIDKIVPQCSMLHFASTIQYSPGILEVYLQGSQAQVDQLGSLYYDLATDDSECLSHTPTQMSQRESHSSFGVLLQQQTPLSYLLYSIAANSRPDEQSVTHINSPKEMFKKFKMLVEYGADPTIKQRTITFAPQKESLATIKHIYHQSEISPLEFVEQQLNEYEEDNKDSDRDDNKWNRGRYYNSIEFYNTYKKIRGVLEPLTAQYESAKALAEAAQTSRSPRDINAALKELRVLRGEKFHPSSWVVRTIKELETMACVAYKLQKIEALDGR